METRRRPIGYVILAVIAIALIGWLTWGHLVKQRLLRNLGSNDMQIRVAAASELLRTEKLEDALPAEPIIRRSKAAQALGEIGTDEAMRLLGIILQDQEEAPRRWARQALEKQGQRAIPTLLQALSAEGDTRDQAVAALEAIGPATAPKTRFFMSDGWAADGAAAALAIAGPVGIDALLRASHNPDVDTRNRALDNLGAEGVEQAVATALDNVTDPLDDSTKTAAIKALGLIGERRAVPDLMPRLQEVDFREAAVTALGQIGDPRAVEPILATMTATDKRYRNAAVLALQRIGAPAIPALVRDLRSREVLMRRAAAAALVGSDTPRVNQALSETVRSASEDAEVRASAALGLGWKNNLEGISPLVDALSAPDWRVVDAAVEALGDIGVNAIQRLQNVVRDPARSLTVRYQVARALASMGQPAVDDLLAALKRPDPEVQKWSAIALGQIGLAQPRIIEGLEELERTGAGDLKWVASEQLRLLRGISTS